MEEATIVNICRTCLAEEGEMQSIFQPDEKTGTNIHLAEMIMAYASVQVILLFVAISNKIKDAILPNKTQLFYTPISLIKNILF